MKNNTPGQKKRLAALVVFSLCCILSVAGQMNLPNANVIPPTPEAASLAKYAETPVGLYTGTPEISVPLWSISDHSLSLNTSLTYHSSGNRVEDIGSSVGLGWSLNAGGAVVRTVRGIPDEQATSGFLAFSSRLSFQNVMTGTDFARYMRYDSVVKGCLDAEPDNFFFNFDGVTGRLSFDWGGNLVVSCSEKIKVAYQLSGGIISSWTITRTNGVTYVFSDDEITRTTETSVVIDECHNFSPITCWYLSEVRSPNNTHKLRFFYNAYDLSYAMTVGEQDYYRNGVTAPESKSPKTVRQLDMAGKLISRIESSDGSSLSFVYNNLRTDVPGNNFKSLDEVQAKDLNGVIRRKFLFTYDYSSGRLTLRQVRETDAANSSLRPPYRFFYNPVALPPINSYAQDHWGYYNSNTVSSLIPALSTRNLVVPSDTNVYTHTGANREIDTSRTRAGLLTQVIYPAGSESFYEYEPNDYSFIQSAGLPNGATRMTGGVRIKRIIERDGSGNSPDNVRLFSYKMLVNGVRVSSGVVFSEIKYTYDYTQRELFNGTYRIVPFTVAMASNRAQLGSATGTHVGYRQVEVMTGLSGEGGKAVSAFSSAFDNPDALYDFQPFPPSVSSDHNRGQLLNEKTYKYSSGQYVLVKEIKNHYSSVQQVANAYKMGYGIGGTYEPGNYDVTRFSITDYHIAMGYAKPDTTEEILYENGAAFNKKSISQYDANLQFLKATIAKGSNGKDVLTQYFYPQDFTSPNAVVQALLARNILPVLEQITSEKGADGIKRTIGGNFLEYGLFGSLVLPSKSYQLLASKPLLNFEGPTSTSGTAAPTVYGELMSMDGYDAFENILQAKSKAKEGQCFLWGYNNSLIVAEVQNASYGDVAYCDFEDSNQGGWSFDAAAANYIANGRTGSRSYKGALLTRDVNEAKAYKVSLWAKGTAGTSIMLNDASQPLTSAWTYFEWDVVDPSMAVIRRPSRTANTGTLSITLPAGAQIDGVRAMPAGALMQTFTYDPLVGVTSTCSANNTIAYYEYDGLGRLTVVRDGNRNIVRQYQYKYANQ